MARFFRKVVLLTQKNIKVRFSHRCLTFCELFFPLIITAITGLVTSYYTQANPVNVEVTASVNDSGFVQSKFQCQLGNPQYNCEKWYDSLEPITPAVFNTSHRVVFVIADSVTDKEGGAELVETVINAVLSGNETKEKNERDGETKVTSPFDSATSNSLQWERSSKSERDLEICVVQKHAYCDGLAAAVIITDVEDRVKEENRLIVKYKIRMMKLFLRSAMTSDLFVEYDTFDLYTIPYTMETFYLQLNYIWDPENIGFVYIQALVDRGIMEYVRQKQNGDPSVNLTDQVQVSLVRMPFVGSSEGAIARSSGLLSLVHSMLASLAIFSLMRVNSEKNSGFKELLRMHGVTLWTQWMGWFLSSVVVYLIWTLLLILLLWLPLLGGSNVLILAEINGIIYWLLLFLFMMSLTAFCYLVSVFFERVWTAASVGLLTWILLTAVMIVASAKFHTLGTWTAMGMMLVPTIAFDFAFRLFLNGGGTFATIGVPVRENVSLTVLHCLVMLLVDCFIFMTLTIYLDNVLPSKYGVRKSPWYVIRNLKRFVKNITQNRNSTAYKKTGKGDDDDMHQNDVELTPTISTEQPFEADPQHLDAAVVMQNLKKAYKRSGKRAVDGLTAKIFTGEIYALLGFNGAGKTSTIGILTGLFAPSDGLASIFDLDIRKDMEEIRRYIGLCPQHNLLYDEMTVVDQVAFFGELKGLAEPANKARELLEWLGMSDKLNSKPSKLSGGQRRRTHLAIALIGDTKLAFLDEPTSGLDPESRRGVWEILLKLRGKVTVVLTTHNMEEADILGDRVGIMSEGKLICNGSPSFLKKYYGVGYNLKMTVASPPHCNLDKVYELVRNYVPQAKLNNIEKFVDCRQAGNSSSLDSTFSISLPTAQLDLLRVAEMLDALRKDKQALGVDNIGLSLATMDDVFLKVGEAVQAVGVTVSVCDPCTKAASSGKWEGKQLEWYRFMSLVLKRAAHFFHAPVTLLCLIVFFGCFLWITVPGITSPQYNVNEPDPPRVVSASSVASYQFPIILLHDNEEPKDSLPTSNFATAYINQLPRHSDIPATNVTVKTFPKNENISKIFDFLKRASLDDLENYRQRYVVGASFTNTKEVTNITGLFSAYALHSAPLAYNLITRTRIKQSFGVDAIIDVVNHPFPESSQTTPLSLSSPFYFISLAPATILLVIMSSLLIGTAALLPTQERLNKGKQMQLMTGTTPFIYWTAMFTWDFFFFSVVNAGITLVYVLAENRSEHRIYTRDGETVIFYLILECHTIAALWFCYLISWAPCVKVPADGYLLVNKFALVVGVLCNLTLYNLLIMIVQEIEDSVWASIIYNFVVISGYVLWLVPMYSLYSSMIKLGWMGSQNNICNLFHPDVLQLACHKSNNVSWESQHKWYMDRCCENCEENCFQSQPYLVSRSLEVIQGFQTHGLVYDLLAMLLCGVVCAAVLFSLEYFVPWRKAKQQMVNMANPIPKGTHPRNFTMGKDEGVCEEAARVDEIVKENAFLSANQCFVAQKLCLNFGTINTVNGVSFGIHNGECFGLLGVSGAGKTSTFRMATGDLFPASGNMFSGEWNCYRDRTSYLSSMGYCPQFDGIIGSLTGLQMVKLYGALRGIPPVALEEDAKIWLDKFGLLGSANKKCAAYSGGMKRRLSAAMAMIGGPKLLLLDEPTSGVDPAFRRQFWKVIREIQERGQSVLLTSYTMDECETLCNRLAIMVDGEFKCLGSIRQLKSKFGQGYLLSIKLKRATVEEEKEHDDNVNHLVKQIMQKFAPCRVQTKQRGLIQYQILSQTVWYSDIFRGMEEICNLPECSQVVEDYAVTETTLEDVFISFAKGSHSHET